MGVIITKRRDHHHYLLIPLARALFLTALAALLLTSWSAERRGEGERRAWRPSSSSSSSSLPGAPPRLLAAVPMGGGGGGSSSLSDNGEDERDNPRPTTAPRVDDGAAQPQPPAAAPPPPDLPAIYRHMHEGLRLKGADAEAIAALRPWYRFGKEVAAETAAATTTTATTGPALPRLYRDPPHLLGARCTRLVLVKLDDERVRSVAYAVADEVMREMSLSTVGGGGNDSSSSGPATATTPIQPDHYLAKPEELHTTVYHVSHPNSVRGCTTDPNPFRTASAAVRGGERAEATTRVPPPPILTQEEWEREGQAASRAVREVAGRHPRAALVLERVLLARSGTVLLAWVEEEQQGAMAELRAALRREMPGASPKQPDIMHTTVLRLLGRAGDGAPSLFFEEDEEGEGGNGDGHHHRARVVALTERLTARFRGTVRIPLFDRVGRIRLASEDRFATVTHEVQLLPVDGDGFGGGVVAATATATA